jgi:hypothetical protein
MRPMTLHEGGLNLLEGLYAALAPQIDGAAWLARASEGVTCSFGTSEGVASELRTRLRRRKERASERRAREIRGCPLLRMRLEGVLGSESPATANGRARLVRALLLRTSERQTRGLAKRGDSGPSEVANGRASEGRRDSRTRVRAQKADERAKGSKGETSRVRARQTNERAKARGLVGGPSRRAKVRARHLRLERASESERGG